MYSEINSETLQNNRYKDHGKNCLGFSSMTLTKTPSSKSFTSELFPPSPPFLKIKKERGVIHEKMLPKPKNVAMDDVESERKVVTQSQASLPVNPATEKKIFNTLDAKNNKTIIQLENLHQCQDCSEKCLLEKNNVILDTKYKEQGSAQKKLVLFVSDYPKRIEEENKETVKTDFFIPDQGQLLHNMIKAMKLSDQEFALSLAIKCASKDPSHHPEMLRNCIKNLHQEIIYYQPKFVISLGSKSTEALLGNKRRLSEIHGQYLPLNIRYANHSHECTLVPIFHPQYLTINPKMKLVTWQDLQKIMTSIGKI